MQTTFGWHSTVINELYGQLFKANGCWTASKTMLLPPLCDNRAWNKCFILKKKQFHLNWRAIKAYSLLVDFTLVYNFLIYVFVVQRTLYMVDFIFFIDGRNNVLFFIEYRVTRLHRLIFFVCSNIFLLNYFARSVHIV